MKLIKLSTMILCVWGALGCGSGASYHVSASSDEDVMANANGGQSQQIDQKYVKLKRLNEHAKRSLTNLQRSEYQLACLYLTRADLFL